MIALLVAAALVRIPAGDADIGSLPAETAAAGVGAAYAAREQPRVRVSVAAFDIGRTEVTRGDFAAFVAATGWKPDGGCAGLVDGPANRWESDSARDWANPGFAQTDRHPVVCVSYADANRYAAWLSATTGDRYRLPTSAEWEYAARAGAAGPGWWRGPADVCRWGNVGDAARARVDGGDPAAYSPCDDGFARTAPVASFRRNGFGLHDMIGNVWEWTSECDPAGGCAAYIDRGASWTNSPKFVRIATRHPDVATARTTVLGFRLVRER